MKVRRKIIILGLLILMVGFAGSAIFSIEFSRTHSLNRSPSVSPSWRLEKVANKHQIEGYASLASVTPGNTIKLSVSCREQTFTTSIFRMGWYRNRGAKYMVTLASHRCRAGNVPKPDKSTGLVNLNWPANVNLRIPSDWEPGIYLAKLTANGGYQSYIPFTVRSPRPESPFLFVHAINTDLAYNIWGGNSLYHGSTPDLKISRAVEASLNRPFTTPVGGNDGSGDFLVWEYPMILFLEQHGYQVDYATDIDIHEHPNLLLKYKSIIITGHDEYWSRQMLEGYKSALAHGVNLAIFAANTAYRPVRFISDPYTKEPDRIMVNYKSATLDPFTKTSPEYSTPAGWISPPLNEPESELLGESYGGEIENGAASTTGGALMVSDDSNWIFKGSGLKNGDKIPGLVGYEYDEFIETSPHPANVSVVFHSPLTNAVKKPGFSDSTYYKLPTGGQVFDAGTMEWSWGLDSSRKTFSSPLVKVTENILNRFGGNYRQNPAGG